MEENVFLWKCHKVRNAQFPGISFRNARGKVFPCVIPLEKNGCGKALLFLPNPELYFPPKMWLKLDFVGLFRSYQKSISNPSDRRFRQNFLTFHYLGIPTQPARKKYSLGSKISSQQKNTFPAIPKWNKRRKTWNVRLRNLAEIRLPCNPACVAAGFQDSFIPSFWLGGS